MVGYTSVGDQMVMPVSRYNDATDRPQTTVQVDYVQTVILHPTCHGCGNRSLLCFLVNVVFRPIGRRSVCLP